MPERYIENPDFVPDATAQFGTLDTSGTGGGSHQRLEETTPIFDLARAADMAVAAKALDPDDPTPSSLVHVADGQRLSVVNEEGLKDKVKEAASAASPVDVFGPTKSEQEAAVSTKDGSEVDDEAETVSTSTSSWSS